MAVKEKWRDVSGDQDRRRIGYIVTATDDNDALNQLELNTPFFYDFMPRENIEVEELSQKDGLYEGRAIYTRRSYEKPAEQTNVVPIEVTGPDEPTSEEPDKDVYSFDVGLENRHEVYPRNFTEQAVAIKPGFANAVGVGEYEAVPFSGFNYDESYGGFRGVDIPRPRTLFTLDWRPENIKVTRSYQNTLENAVGKVNSERFRGKLAGEVMCVALRGESRNSADWQFSATFEVRKTRASVDLGNGVTFSSVAGWDRIDPWFVWRIVDVGSKKVSMRVCRQAIVWRDHERIDFSTIFV